MGRIIYLHSGDRYVSGEVVRDVVAVIEYEHGGNTVLQEDGNRFFVANPPVKITKEISSEQLASIPLIRKWDTFISPRTGEIVPAGTKYVVRVRTLSKVYVVKNGKLVEE